MAITSPAGQAPSTSPLLKLLVLNPCFFSVSLFHHYHHHYLFTTHTTSLIGFGHIFFRQSITTCLVQAGCTSPSLDSLARSCQWSCIRLPPSLLIIFKQSILAQRISTRKVLRYIPRSINTYLLGSSRVYESLVSFARSFMPMVLHQAASFTTHYIQTINSYSIHFYT